MESEAKLQLRLEKHQEMVEEEKRMKLEEYAINEKKREEQFHNFLEHKKSKAKVKVEKNFMQIEMFHKNREVQAQEVEKVTKKR
mmetsp:Transcript_18026/g.17213  ORF Transcript_18026/g.17213 Transcript_18026/m.17213 type:complete len:84 (-) Transcript_18026:1135-1386(-)